MFAELRAVSIRHFEKRIKLPQLGYFVSTEIGARFGYWKDGILEYIHVTKQELAGLMYKLGLIKGFHYDEDGTLMVTKSILSTKRISNSIEFIQTVDKIHIPIHQVRFSQSEALHVCAIHEFEKVGGTMGVIEARIIPFTTYQIA